MTEPKQAVVDETKVAAQPATEVDSARKDDGDIDAILSQFDKEVKTPVTPEPKKQQQEPPDWARSLLAEKEARDYQQAVKEFFGDKKISDRMARGWIDVLVREKPDVAHAYFNRDKNPAAWSKVKKWAQGEWERDNPAPIDEAATADHDAVAAAVRGSSTKVAAEPAPKLGNMSDNELRKYTLENFGF